MNEARKVSRMLTGAKCATYLVFAVFAAAMIVARPVVAASLVETIKQVKPSIVGVGTYQEITRPPSKLLGTGFLVIDDRHIITNSHVLPKSLQVSQREFYCIFVGKGRSASIVRVEVVMRDDTHDIALLRAEKPIEAKPMALRAAAELAEGEQVAFTGFPIGTVLGLHPVTHRGIISAKTPIVIPQVTPKRLDPKMIKRLREAFEVYQLDATAYPGNSGSPLYDPANGDVVGIVSSVFIKSSKEKALSDPSGITYAIPIDYAIRMLKKAGLLKP
ncbi:MAG: serine protease Do [Paracoccaceae bacterium]|jgi:serine protease Do